MRELKFRRRQDRIILGFAIVVILGGFWAYTQGCTSKGPTIPDPVVTTPATPAPVAVTPQPVTATPAPNPTATPDTRRIFADCNNATGICTFRSEESKAFNVSGKCTEPAQDAAVYGTWNGTVVDGDTVDARDVCNKIEAEDCKPVTKPVQVDFASGGRHIGHLGPLWQMRLEQKLPPEECEECVEWKEPRISSQCGEFNECHEHPQASTVAPPRQCFQEKECVETTTWNCKDPTERKYEETAECPCDCIEWEEPVITRERIPGEWSACEPRLTVSTGGGGAECKRWREVELTITRTWNCKEPEIKTETKRESEACDCPVDDSLCHISNQGGPGDTNFNLIITPAAGHAHHSQANGFCPGDLLASNCNCRAARAAAEVCGDPAAGGFVCKDNRN